MSKMGSEYERIREVSRRLFSTTWVRRWGGGNEAEATARLADKFGFEGRTTYMRSLCDLLDNNPDQASFERAVHEMVTDGKRRLVERLQDCEVDVSAALRGVTTPEAMLVGDCYRQAFYFMRDHSPPETRLIHGRISDGISIPCVTHAWLELPNDVIFDGVMQRFYRKKAYYERRGAVADRTYTLMDAILATAHYHHFGPWDD